MKSMTCNQLGGACKQVFSGETFDDLAAQSQQHGKEMFGASDGPHMAAISNLHPSKFLLESSEWAHGCIESTPASSVFRSPLGYSEVKFVNLLAVHPRSLAG